MRVTMHNAFKAPESCLNSGVFSDKAVTLHMDFNNNETKI